MAVLERGLRDFLCAGIPHSGGAIASATRETAEALLGWIQLDCNKEPVEAFTKEVVKALDSVLPEQPSSQASREKMWGAYHSLRTSPTFTSVWRRFLEAANVVPLPLFYQSLTDTLFQGRIELHFTISCTPEQGNALSFEEENAIRYAVKGSPKEPFSCTCTLIQIGLVIVGQRVIVSCL